MKKPVKILAIETSCDETAAAVVEEQMMENGEKVPVVLSNIISSQIDLHAKTGGVVPEVASRAHVEAMIPVITEALLSAEGQIEKTLNPKPRTLNHQKAIKLLSDVTHIAVTAGPGLIGSLLVGFNSAKSIAYAGNLPIVPVNHIEGHIYSALGGINSSEDQVVSSKGSSSLLTTDYSFPLLVLTVSGGHTLLLLAKSHGEYEVLGETLDDAVGEAYDKVAKLLGLGYPGGPIVSKLAGQFRAKREAEPKDRGDNTSSIVFPRPIINDGTYNFSFSGLKTAVLQKVKNILAENGWTDGASMPEEIKREIAAAFEEAVAAVLCSKLEKAVEVFSPRAIAFTGGVSANSYLKEILSLVATNKKLELYMPGPQMSGDNAAMIGLAAYYKIKEGGAKRWDEIGVDSNMSLV